MVMMVFFFRVHAYELIWRTFQSIIHRFYVQELRGAFKPFRKDDSALQSAYITCGYLGCFSPPVFSTSFQPGLGNRGQISPVNNRHLISLSLTIQGRSRAARLFVLMFIRNARRHFATQSRPGRVVWDALTDVTFASINGLFDSY